MASLEPEELKNILENEEANEQGDEAQNQYKRKLRKPKPRNLFEKG